MDDSGPTASWILFLILIAVDFFFFGFGAAADGINTKEVERRALEGDIRSSRLMKILDTPQIYINTLQMAVTFAHVMTGVLYASFFDLSPGRSALLLVGMLYIMLTFGILLPKKIAARMPEKWAYALSNPVYFVTRLLWPFTWIVAVTVKGLLFLLGFRTGETENEVTEEEIINMVNEGHEQGVIQASEAELISNIFEYGDKEAQDIMTHRNDIIALEGSTLLKDAISFMLDEKNSRYPVYEDDIDHIIGILHLKDALRMQARMKDDQTTIKKIKGLLRKPLFVPQTKNIDELFKKMQSEKIQMVIVVNEYGQTDGLIAMEDILEEIVGNIQDEYDVDTKYIEEKGQDEYIMEGKTPLEELEERFHISFDKEAFETLNGFLISKLDRIPEPDEQFDVDHDGYHFKILSVENKMIQRVLVTKLPPEALTTEEPEDLAQSVLDEKEK